MTSNSAHLTESGQDVLLLSSEALYGSSLRTYLQTCNINNYSMHVYIIMLCMCVCSAGGIIMDTVDHSTLCFSTDGVDNTGRVGENPQGK